MDLFVSSDSAGSPPSLLSLLAGSSSRGGSVAAGWEDRDSTVLSSTDIIAENRQLDKTKRDAFNKTGWKNVRDEEGDIRKVYTTFRAGGIVRAGGNEGMKLFLGDTKGKKKKENKVVPNDNGTAVAREGKAAASKAGSAGSGDIASFFSRGNRTREVTATAGLGKRVIDLLDSDSEQEDTAKKHKM